VGTRPDRAPPPPPPSQGGAPTPLVWGKEQGLTTELTMKFAVFPRISNS
jgi:hypothetical protein